MAGGKTHPRLSRSDYHSHTATDAALQPAPVDTPFFLRQNEFARRGWFTRWRPLPVRHRLHRDPVALNLPGIVATS